MDDEADEKYFVVLSHEDHRAKHQRSIQDLPIGTVIDELPCLFYVIDTTSHLVLWNFQIEDALEMSGDEIRLETVDRFFDPADRPVIVQKLAEAFEHGTAYIEAELVGKHGKRTSYLFNCAGAQVDGQACLFGTGVDISARKRTEQILKVRDRAIFQALTQFALPAVTATRIVLNMLTRPSSTSLAIPWKKSRGAIHALWGLKDAIQRNVIAFVLPSDPGKACARYCAMPEKMVRFSTISC